MSWLVVLKQSPAEAHARSWSLRPKMESQFGELADGEFYGIAEVDGSRRSN